MEEFPPRAYELLKEFEELSIFEGLTKEQIKEKIGMGDKEIVGFIKNYLEKQMYNYKNLLGESEVENEVILALNEKYESIFQKIGDAIILYIKSHPGTWIRVFQEVEEAYKVIFDSQAERLKLEQEIEDNLLSEKRLEEMQKSIEHLERERDKIHSKLVEAERKWIEEKTARSLLLSEISRLEKEKERISREKENLVSQWDKRFSQLELARAKLEEKERLLEEKRNELKEENQKILNEELKRIDVMKKNLLEKAEEYESMKKELQIQNNILSERIQNLRNALESGETGELVKGSEALALEMSFIERVSHNIREHMSKKENISTFNKNGIRWNIIREEYHDDSFRLVGNGIPLNRSVAFIFQKKHLLGKPETTMIIEGSVIAHMDSYLKNGFDNVSVSLSEVMARIEENLKRYPGRGYVHAMYLASPTGFDPSVRKYFSGTRPGEGFYHTNVVVFLQDLRDAFSSPIYNRQDSMTALFSDMLRMPREEEILKACKEKILEVLKSRSVVEGWSWSSLTFSELKNFLGDYKEEHIKKSLEELTQEGVIESGVLDNSEPYYYLKQKEE